MCAHVLVGAGAYSLGLRGATVRGPGIALTGGMEIPTGERGALQLDATVHAINTRSRPPIAFSQTLVLNLTVGWIYRF